MRPRYGTYQNQRDFRGWKCVKQATQASRKKVPTKRCIGKLEREVLKFFKQRIRTRMFDVLMRVRVSVIMIISGASYVVM